MSLLLSFLKPYEATLWAVAAMVLIAAGAYTIHRIEVDGENKVHAADAKAEAAQVIHTEEVERRAKQIVDASNSQLHTALVAPAPVDSLVVRVCPSTGDTGKNLPANGGSVAGSGAGQTIVQGSVAANDSGRNIGPDTERLLSEADAEIAYWRSYYRECKAEGVCQ